MPYKQSTMFRNPKSSFHTDALRQNWLFSIILTTIFSFQSSALGQNMTDPRLDELETSLFGHASPKKPTPVRVQKLEQLVFGKPVTGTTGERTAKLYKIVLGDRTNTNKPVPSESTDASAPLPGTYPTSDVPAIAVAPSMSALYRAKEWPTKLLAAGPWKVQLVTRFTKDNHGSQAGRDGYLEYKLLLDVTQQPIRSSWSSFTPRYINIQLLDQEGFKLYEFSTPLNQFHPIGASPTLLQANEAVAMNEDYLRRAADYSAY